MPIPFCWKTYVVDGVIVRVQILPRKVEWSEKKIFRKRRETSVRRKGLSVLRLIKAYCFSTDTDHAKAVPSAAMAVFFHRCSGREKPVWAVPDSSREPVRLSTRKRHRKTINRKIVCISAKL
ncbi:hypothetical protein TNCV_5073141 [Trichonephila clavipes]|nr:hypothetical protein TNCV_5073141 [Trichonephila clavipes]